MNIQYLIVTVILAIAVGYGAWRIYRALRMANDPCYGCEGCELKELRKTALRKNKPCEEKK